MHAFSLAGERVQVAARDGFVEYRRFTWGGWRNEEA